MMGAPNLVRMPERNLYPAVKWKRYLVVLQALQRLCRLKGEICHDIRVLERESESLRSELLDAVTNGAGIEDGGRIA